MGTKKHSNYSDLITFTRASGGTSLRPVSYGAELVTNGTFDTDVSGWTKVGDVATTFTHSSGRLLVDAASTLDGVQQSINTTAGKVYRMTADITLGTSSSARIYADGYFVDTSSDASLDLVFVASSTTVLTRVDSYSGTGTFYADNISVKEVTFDQADGTLTLFNHPDDVPRIEYNADGERLGLLVEESRTNLIDDSEALDGWLGEGEATSDVTAPDGRQTATKIGDDAGGGVGTVKVYKTVTVSTSTEYTFSAFCKKGQLSWSALGVVNFTTPVNGRVWFDLENGTVGTEDTGLTGSIEAFPDGWYRCSVTFTTDAADTSGNVYVYACEGNNRFVDTARDGTSDVYAWGAQLEQGAFPTSYIKSNSGSTTTRSADVASMSVDAFGYNKTNTVGTFYVSWDTFDAGDGRALSVTDAGGSNRTVDMFFNTATARTDVYSNHTTSALYNLGSPTSGLNEMIAAMKENDAAACTNGGTVVTDTTTTAPIVATKFNIGSFGGSSYLNGHIKSIKYYPRRLSNAQLVEITS